MSKKSKIRWSDKDAKELKRRIKNFNAKIDYVFKTDEKRDIKIKGLQPEKIRYKDIKGDIETRKDLNRMLNSLGRYSERKAETPLSTKTGVTSTKWDIKETGIKRGVVARGRILEAKQKNIDVKLGNLGALVDERLTPPRKVENVKPDDFEAFKEALEKEIINRGGFRAKEQFRDNYISEAYFQLGNYAEEIEDLVMKIDLDVFVEQASTRPLLKIKYLYTRQDQETKRDILVEEWSKYL